MQEHRFPFHGIFAEHFGTDQSGDGQAFIVHYIGATHVIATSVTVHFTTFKFDRNGNVGRHRNGLRSSRSNFGRHETHDLPHQAFQSAVGGILAGPFGECRNTRTGRRAGIAVGLVVATANRVVLHGTDTIRLDVFDAFFRGVAGEKRKEEDGEEEGVFHSGLVEMVEVVELVKLVEIVEFVEFVEG